MHEHATNALPDESLAADILPVVLTASFVVAIGVCGLLLIFEKSGQFAAYSIPALIFISTLTASQRRHMGQTQNAGLIISYTYGLVPLITIPVFGIVNNPVIYMAPIGVGLAALLVSPDSASVLARLYGLLLIAVALVFTTPLTDAIVPVVSALVLLAACSLLSWVSAYSVQGTIDWALETGYKSERRELLLRETQRELERALFERDRLNLRLQQVNTDLERAKLAAEAAYRSKSSFMASMSHELRTPLNLVIGFSTAMLEHPEMYADEPLPELYRNDIREIQQSGKHLLQLINDILDLAKVEAGKLELQTTTLDVHPLLIEAVKAGKTLIKSPSIDVRGEFPEQLPLVVADEIRIRQVLLNLVSNACKFTDEGEIVVGARAIDNALEIWVRDTGIGIKEEDQVRVFGEFEQVENHDSKQQGGTGLGLSICRWLVELHGGEIWLRSSEGKGSVFTFTLPCVSVQMQGRSSAVIEPEEVAVSTKA